MHEWTSMVSALGVGLWQESGDLPTHVPGIDGGTAPVEGQPAGTTPGQGGTTTSPGLFSPMLLIILAMFAFLIFTSMSSSRREKKRVASMLAGLKRGDRVQTLAGMLGTVHEVKDDSIVLRVDDMTGTKIHFAKSAVQHIVKSARADSKGEDAESGK